MPHFVSTKEETEQNINDIASDFACLKVSALKKASRISGEVDRVTIGPDSTVNANEIESKNENKSKNANDYSINILGPQNSNRLQNKDSVQSGITFSMKKILLESEYQRKEKVRKEIERHCQQMKENDKVIQEHVAKSCLHMARERERKSKENYAYILAEERIAEQEEMLRRSKQEKEVEECRRRMQEKEELIKRAIDVRNMYAVKCHNIMQISASCKNAECLSMISPYLAKLEEEMCYQIKLTADKVKTGEVTAADLSLIEKIVQQHDEMGSLLKSEVDRINAQYEADTRETESQSLVQPEDLQKETAADVQVVYEAVPTEQISTNNVIDDTKNSEDAQEEKDVQIESEILSDVQEIPDSPVAEECVSTTATSTDYLKKYVDKESLVIYMKSQKFLENYTNGLAEFVQSTNTKKFRFECQKAINIPVNAISGINQQHLRDKYERLHNLLIGKSTPNVNQHPQGAAFCMNTLAKKIVNQGETLISSKPKMAFPIAAVVVALWNDHPELGELLLSHFHSLCPYIVPVFMPKMVGQSNEDYYKLMGYKYGDDGTVERHDKFLKRMSGLMRLYASIIITSQRKGINKSSPHGLQNAWRWLAAVLNIEPRKEVSDLCATLLLDMLEVAGNMLWTAYPKQFRKLLILLSEEYYPRIKSVGCIGGGPLVRLEEFLRNSLTKGTIAPAEGQLPPNFW